MSTQEKTALEELREGIVETTVERERKLTPRRERFIKEMILAPGSPRKAAIRAGYSPKSAHVLASRLMKDPVIQHELAQHFLDQEKTVSEALEETLTRLHGIVREGGNEAFLKAAKLLMDYVKIATPILGLDFKKPEKAEVETGPVNAEDLIEQHLREIARLRQLLPRRTPESKDQSREGEVQ